MTAKKDAKLRKLAKKRKQKQPVSSLRKYLQQGLIDFTGKDYRFIPKPLGLEKMSDCLEKIAEPFLGEDKDDEAIDDMIALAVIAWNMSVMGDPRYEEGFQEIARDRAETEEGQREIISTLRTMMQRKQELYPHDTRSVLGFTLGYEGGELRLEVAYTLPQPDSVKGLLA